MYHEPTVFVVDNDEPSRKSVCALVSSMGVRVEAFASAEEFLDSYTEPRPGCLVTDYCMRGMNGLELQEELARRRLSLPFIVLTAYAHTSLTVRAMQTGAVTLLDKPYAHDDLWEAIRKALADCAAQQGRRQRRRELRERLTRLTTGESRVLDLLVQGKANKQIAKELNVSVRTVESRRREILVKMEADSLPELFRLVTDAGQVG
jgi:two-component system, LuxR family, response regulator FixJ